MTFDLPLEPIVRVLLAAIRAGLVILMLPLPGGEGVPAPVRVLLSFALGALFMQSVPGTVPASLSGLLLAAGREAVIGLALGLLCRVLLAAPANAGDLIAQELGLKMAEEVDPFTRVPATAVSRLYETVLLLAFLAVHGHHDVLRALQHSFGSFPVGGSAWPDGLAGLVRALSLCLRASVMIAAPLFAVLSVGSLVLAILARTVPDLQVMTFGYPLRLVAAMAAAVVLFPLCLKPGLALVNTLRQSLLALAGA